MTDQAFDAHPFVGLEFAYVIEGAVQLSRQRSIICQCGRTKQLSQVEGTLTKLRDALRKRDIASAIGKSYGGRIAILPAQATAKEFSTLVLFGSSEPGWSRAVAIPIVSTAKSPITTTLHGPKKLRWTCRRMSGCQHLAIALSRCMNLPARHVTSYAGDIRSRYSKPGDFGAARRHSSGLRLRLR
ncbi:hypothetical protein [Tunturiibacter psychrotolerans]|uniref:hypothetical protein n=1 Tax=Tunturiibacter psychrotolerans TaxID=3069686 RepID=UPI003D1BF240